MELGKFDTKLGGVGMDRLRIKMDLDKLEKLSETYRMEFNKERCKELRLGQNNQVHKCKIGSDWPG